jgi:hypothetical protein
MEKRYGKRTSWMDEQDRRLAHAATLQDELSSIGSAHFSLVAIQVILYGLNDDLRALDIERPSALQDEIHKSVVKIRAELHLDSRHIPSFRLGSINNYFPGVL